MHDTVQLLRAHTQTPIEAQDLNAQEPTDTNVNKINRLSSLCTVINANACTFNLVIRRTSFEDEQRNL